MSLAIRLSDRALDVMILLTTTVALALAARHLAALAEMHAARENLCAQHGLTATCRLLCWMARR
jgi:hypothetical protein